MKKIRNLVLIFLVGIIAITGCSKKNKLAPSEALKKAAGQLNTTDNYKMGISLGMAFALGESMSVDMNASGSVIVDVKNGLSYTKISVNMTGEEATTETYTDTKSKDGKLIVYAKTSDDDKWVKSETAFVNQNNQFNEFFNNLVNSENIKELKADKDNYNYELTISSDQLKQITSLYGTDDMGLTNGNTDSFKMNISIDKETGNYSKISVDMTDIIKNATGNIAAVKITKAEFAITISDINKAEAIKIPEAALNVDEDDDLQIINSFATDDYDKTVTCSIKNDSIESEIVFGLNNDKYVKSLEETVYTFDTDAAAESFWNEQSTKDNDKSIFHMNNKVIISNYHDAEGQEKDYTTSDLKAMLEKDGYLCE